MIGDRYFYSQKTKQRTEKGEFLLFTILFHYYGQDKEELQKNKQ